VAQDSKRYRTKWHKAQAKKGSSGIMLKLQRANVAQG
jgi:hypothetical protein